MAARPMPARAPQAPDQPVAVPPDFDATHFRRSLAQFATGVTIATTLGPDGRPVGLTANSFNSVSLDPPLVLWSLAAKSSSMPAFAGCERWAITVLAADQVDLARRFASRVEDRFEGVRWRTGTGGVPVIEGGLAWFECFARSRHVEGDHVILVGEVERCGFADGAPLLFHCGDFGLLATDDVPG